MKRIRIFLLLTFLCSASPSFSAPIDDFSPSQLSHAIALVNEFLNGATQNSFEVLQQLTMLHPKGPAFIDQALARLVADDSRWKSYSDRRARILTLIATSTLESGPWLEIKDSDLKQSIHRNAQKLLSKFPNAGDRQAEVISIFRRLDLWDETDLPFLRKKYFNRRRINSETAAFIKWFGLGSPEFKEQFASRVRREPRQLLNYALLYRHDLINDDELIILLRAFMTDSVSFESELKKEKAKPLFDWVLKDLHQRLHQGEPRIVTAYEKVRASPLWAGNWSLTPNERANMNQFLRDLWTGKFNSDCDANLIAIPKTEDQSGQEQTE